MMDEKILVIKLGALGDFVQSLGPMRAIRHHHKNAHITLLTTAPFQKLAKESGYFNDIIIDCRPKFFQLSKWYTLHEQLNDPKFSHVYDLQNNDRTEFYLKLFSQKPIWVGAAKGATIRNNLPERTQGLAFHGHVQTLALAGINNVEIDRMEWVKGNADYNGLKKPYILLVPGSAPSRPEKRWPAEHYASLASIIFENGFQPVLIGTDAERAVTDEITMHAPCALNLTGQTSLFDIVALARDAAGAIGNDTGPMHMIAPTAIPTLVLFSQHSNPKRHAPIGAHVKTIREDNLKDLSPQTVWNEFQIMQRLHPCKDD
jgi:ADP-heptose:LPS heptosyltransferase